MRCEEEEVHAACVMSSSSRVAVVPLARAGFLKDHVSPFWSSGEGRCEDISHAEYSHLQKCRKNAPLILSLPRARFVYAFAPHGVDSKTRSRALIWQQGSSKNASFLPSCLLGRRKTCAQKVRRREGRKLFFSYSKGSLLPD